MGPMQFWRLIVFNLIIHINQNRKNQVKSICCFLIGEGLLMSHMPTAQRTMFVSNNNYEAPVITVPSLIITNGLVFHVDAANSSSYAGSGNVWSTLVGSNHINFFTSASYSTSGNPAYSTDGGGSLVTTGLYGRSIANSGITGSAARSFEAWVKFNSISANAIMTIGSASSDQLFEMMAYQNYLINHPYGGFTQGSTVLSTNTWYQVVITYDGTTNHAVFVNGVQVGTSSGAASRTLNTSNTPLYIGTSSLNWGDFKGKIAMLRIYNRALSSSDVTFNFNALRSRFGL